MADENLQELDDSLEELCDGSECNQEFVCLNEKTGETLKNKQGEILRQLGALVKIVNRNEKKNVERHNNINKRLRAGEKKFDELEKRLDKKDYTNGHKFDEQDKIKKEVEELEGSLGDKATKEDKKDLETKIDKLSDNVWKLVVAIIGVGATLIIFFMGLALSGGV